MDEDKTFSFIAKVRFNAESHKAAIAYLGEAFKDFQNDVFIKSILQLI